MYPDPITPRAHPDLLQQVSYDPFHVMPTLPLPPAPRVFVRAGQIERARQRLKAGSGHDVHAFEQLIASCKLDAPLPPITPTDSPPDWGGPLLPSLKLAFANALAWHLTKNQAHRDRALEAMRQVAAEAAKTTWNGYEHNEAVEAGRAYDLLAASGLDPADDNAFREMLWNLVQAMDRESHHACNNHNSMQMAGRLSLATALGHLGLIHDTFYGCQRAERWRYGLIHLLRHDFLADGMQWEGAPGYHMLVLGRVFECFQMMENLGVDLWQRAWPSALQNDAIDEHRGWGPKGDKSLKAAIDALFYQGFANGDYSLLHDQVLGNLRGAWVWWWLFHKAYEKYQEPRYAWAVTQLNHGQPVTAEGLLPAWFADPQAAVEFVRIEGRTFPAGENPLLEDRQFSLQGRHANGCSLFPMHGSAILRSDPSDGRSLGAYLYWGPHSAGHRSPAALHLDVHALGRRITNSPHLFARGYADPRHLTWHRATIAYNTVAVDQQTMFPYDFESDSLWECDRWRDSISDGSLVQFHAGPGYSVARASNDNVYREVTLDRTVVLTRHYLLDVYRVNAAQARLLDWAMHCHGRLKTEAHGPTIELGSLRGYRHFSGSKLHPQRTGWLTLPIELDAQAGHVSLWLDAAPQTQLIISDDPPVDDRRPIGDLRDPEPRTCLMLRTRAASALFVSLWSFDSSAPTAQVVGAAASDLQVDVQHADARWRWRLPMQGDVTCA